MKLILHSIGEGRYTFSSKTIPLSDLYEGNIDVEFKIYIKDNAGVFSYLYNTYTGNFVILTEGKRALAQNLR